MKTILSGVQTWTRTWTERKIKESTADWNQNDSKADNYIKNRTHYDHRVPITTEEVTVNGTTPPERMIKLADSIDFDLRKVIAASLYTSTGDFIENIPVVVYSDENQGIVIDFIGEYSERWPFTYFETQQQADNWWDSADDNPLSVGLYASVYADEGEPVDVAYSFTFLDGDFRQLDNKYLSSITKSNDCVCDVSFTENVLRDSGFQTLIGQYKVIIDGFEEIVQFKQNPTDPFTYAELHAIPNFYFLETSTGFLFIDGDLNGEEHEIYISEDKEVIKPEYLPKNPDIVNIQYDLQGKMDRENPEISGSLVLTSSGGVKVKITVDDNGQLKTEIIQ